MQKIAKAFDVFKNGIYNKFSENPAKMLIFTGVLGWFLSSAAQVGAIIFNDKIPKEQKLFLIPQEIGDGAVNVLSFLVITSGIKALTSKLVSTGKLATPALRKFIKGGNIPRKKIGDVTFDLGKHLETIGNTDLLKEYKSFKKGTDVIGMTIGSIISCNLFTPVVRNKIAAERQQKMLAREDIRKSNEYIAPRGISMTEFQRMAMMKHSSGLKI